MWDYISYMGHYLYIGMRVGWCFEMVQKKFGTKPWNWDDLT